MDHRIFERDRERRGLALMFALCLLVVVTLLISATLRSNVSRRQYNRLRRDGAQGAALARSGIEEAIHRIAGQSGEQAFSRRLGRGSYEARWEPEPGKPQTFVITATGIGNRDLPDLSRRTARCRVTMQAPESKSDKAVASIKWLE